jgi:hypothetical protein
MKRCYSTFLRSLLCVAVLAAAAYADDKPWSSQGPNDNSVQAQCNLQGYKSEVQTLSPAAVIPDNNATGVTVGPIVLPPDSPVTTIGDVVIDLRAAHTFIGDLEARVLYDETCDGTIDAVAIILCRPGATSCGHFNSPFGCGTDLVCTNTYNFDDTGATGLGLNAAGACLTSPTVNAGGCFKPTGVGSSLLSVFEGRRKGGCWFLNVRDMAATDTGTICAWSVHILNNVTIGVEQRSWSQAKVLYN